MKTILLFLILITTDVFSQWTRITNKVVDFHLIISTKPYAVNGDSVYVFRDKVGWFKSYDSGEYWVKDNDLFRSEENMLIYPIFISPIFKENMVYIYDGNSGLLQISEDYGKSFNTATVYSSYKKSYSKFIDLNGLTFDEDVIFASTTIGGIYISFDKGFTWYNKGTPGIWPSYIFSDIATGVAIIDTTIFVSSYATRQGGVLKSINFHKYDTTNSVYYPISQPYMLNKYKDDFVHSGTRSYNIIYFKNKLYVIFTDGVGPGLGTFSNVWISQDKGDTWEEQNYSHFGIENVKRITQCGDYLYLVEDGKGVFMSGDEGKSWELLNVGFMEEPDEYNNHQRYGNMQFSENFAYLTNGFNLYRAPLKDCKIVTDISSVESTQTEPKIFPNPASERITISGVGLGKLELYNTLGQKLIEKEITGTTQINTSTLQTGLYIIKLESAGEVVFEKVIVAR